MPFFFLLLMGGVKNHMVGPIRLLFDTSMEIGGLPCTHGYPIPKDVSFEYVQ
jgi:hypothetical protein